MLQPERRVRLERLRVRRERLREPVLLRGQALPGLLQERPEPELRRVGLHPSRGLPGPNRQQLSRPR